jgi:hypothetical protein
LPGSLSRSILCASLLVTSLIYPGGLCGTQAEDRAVPYRILRNEIMFKQRWIDILVDENDFSLDNLNVLMNDFFQKYPNPERLMVYVATDISQLGDFAKFTDPKTRPAALRASAGLHREKNRDFITYRFPGEKLRTLVIKETRRVK